MPQSTPILLSILSCLLATSVHAQELRFQRHLLNADSEFSAAAVLDVNGDGQLDIACGAYWYRGPDWQRFRFREVTQIRGRYDDYSNLPLDVDQDGDLDLVSVNYRSKSLYWVENPGAVATRQSSEVWRKHVIDEPGTSETGLLADVDNDGHLDVLPAGTSFAAWYRTRRAAEATSAPPKVEWQRYELPEELIGHGIGAGDVNGDGRCDIIGPNGWAEGPADPRHERWVWHGEFQLARDCALPILCLDVDGDGDQDLIWSRGHNIGLYWTEQRSEAPAVLGNQKASLELQHALPGSRWVTHAIDTQIAGIHTLMLADLDGDGRQNLVAGKRYLGHDGRDPGENDPLSFTWYRFEADQRTWSTHPITFGGTCGVDLNSMCADLDGDGDMDIVAPARCGLHWIENLGPSTGHPSAEPLQPEVPDYTGLSDPMSLKHASGQVSKIAGPLEHGQRRQHVLAQLESVMGTLPSSQQRVPLNWKVEDFAETDRYYRLTISYQAEPSDRVPALLLIPKGLTTPAAAMLCLHPTHFELGKAQICGLGGKPSRFYAHELAERGFVCLAPDYPGFADYRSYAFEQDDYASGSMKAIWNNLRGVDLLESLPCVQRDAMGVIGHSLGGHNALFTACFDQRLKRVVTSCGFTRFADYYQGDLTGWTSDRYMPRIKEVYQSNPERMPFDFPDVLAAIAPRPLFVNAPLHDDNFAVRGVRKCEQAIGPLYELLGASQHLRFVYPDSGHDFPQGIREQVYDWLDAL